MRYTDGHKESVRARIVEAASQALRRDGIDAVSIPKLMKLAGLTHGAFYAHFRSRDHLVAEAVAFAGADTGRRIFAEAESVDEVLKEYLSSEHVNHPESGCVLAALGPEGSRQKAPVRRVFAEIARGLFRRVEKQLHPESKRETVSDEALAIASRMVGAVVLARLVEDNALAKRILAAAKSADTH
jgi:TetR/AcrR family transcriptional repressor of nem operon